MIDNRYDLHISEEILDPEWDEFLESTPGGDHLQTGAWARVKTSLGWRPLRLVVRRKAQIVGGAQMLIRATPVVGAIGCIANGPIYAVDDPTLMALVNTRLQEITRDYSLQKLCLQPPRHYAGYQDALQESGFRPSTFRLMPPGTTRLDLSQSLEEILAAMKSRTRYNIRRSERKGVVVRTGNASDMETYYDLVLATTNRKQFSPFPRRYYEDCWNVLHPRGYMHLLVAEVGGETISSLMLITFGDTAVNKLGVWSGKHGDKRPNDAIHWAAIKFARRLGYRYYDMGGITQTAAEAVLRDEPLPDSAKQTVTSFKLDFGGEVILFPRASEFHPNPLYRWAFSEVYPRLHKHRTVKRAFNWLRTHQPLIER